MSKAHYYEQYGAACDWIVKCADCKALVTHAQIQTLGMCVCGCKRMKQINILTDADRAAIDGLEFPHKAEFLAEFTPVPEGVA